MTRYTESVVLGVHPDTRARLKNLIKTMRTAYPKQKFTYDILLNQMMTRSEERLREAGVLKGVL